MVVQKLTKSYQVCKFFNIGANSLFQYDCQIFHVIVIYYLGQEVCHLRPDENDQNMYFIICPGLCVVWIAFAVSNWPRESKYWHRLPLSRCVQARGLSKGTGQSNQSFCKIQCPPPENLCCATQNLPLSSHLHQLPPNGRYVLPSISSLCAIYGC